MNKIEYQKFLESVPKYKTHQEKDASILVLDKNIDILKLKELLNLKGTNLNEIIAMIFQSRKISVSEIIDITVNCNCNNVLFKEVDINDLFFNGDLHTDIPIKIVTTSEDILDLYDDISLLEFEEIEKKFSDNNKSIFNPVVELKCPKCNSTIKTNINFKDIISKFTIKNIFEQYVDITTFTNMNKKDVDDMAPFEREIFIGIIQDKENKG